MKVSIIIPVYNAAEYIARCLDSIINQTYKDIEILVVNDGSTDLSEKIITGYKDRRIIYLKKTNEGVSATRNYALNRITGDYVTFIDADDYVESKYIEEFVQAINSNSADIVCCGYNYVGATGNVMGAFPGREDKLHLNKDGYLSKEEFVCGMLMHASIGCSLWNKFYNVSLIGEIRFDSFLKYGEDMVFLVQYLNRCNACYFIKEKNYNYYVNPNGAMKSIRKASVFETKWLTEWKAVKLIEKEIPIDSTKYNAILEYKKTMVSTKLLKKAKQCLFWDINCEEMYNFLKESFISCLHNPYLGLKTKIRIIALILARGKSYEKENI